MLAELLQALAIHIVQHTRSTSCHFAPLFETVHLALAVGLGFAVHVVVIVWFAAGADEEGGAEEGRGGGADFGDFGDAVREGGRVEEDLLVESWKMLVGR